MQILQGSNLIRLKINSVRDISAKISSTVLVEYKKSSYIVLLLKHDMNKTKRQKKINNLT